MAVAVAIAARPLSGQTTDDSSFVERVRREATAHSQVMEYAFTIAEVRGIYLPMRDEQLRARFETWFAPLAGMGATAVVPIREPSGSDHATFYRAGVPAFMFVQDPLEYRTRTRHSNMDVSDYLQPEDMQQAAAVVAAFVYQAAMSGEWPRPAVPGK